MTSSITVQELKKILNDVSIIDVRRDESSYMERIGNAIYIPLEKLYIEPSKYLIKDKTYYLYCDYGISTPGLCKYLNSQGYHTIHIDGGYEAWLKSKNEIQF